MRETPSRSRSSRRDWGGAAPIGLRTACGLAAEASRNTAFRRNFGSMASVAAFVMTLASDEPNVTVLFHEGIESESPAVPFFGSDRDDAPDAGAGGGCGTAMKRGVGSGRGANTSRNRRGGAAVAAGRKPRPTSAPPTSAHTSNRPHRDPRPLFSGETGHRGVRVEQRGLRAGGVTVDFVMLGTQGNSMARGCYRPNGHPERGHLVRRTPSSSRPPHSCSRNFLPLSAGRFSARRTLPPAWKRRGAHQDRLKDLAECLGHRPIRLRLRISHPGSPAIDVVAEVTTADFLQ